MDEPLAGRPSGADEPLAGRPSGADEPLAGRPDRYGAHTRAPRRGRWIAIGLTGLVVVAGVVVAAIGYARLGPGDVKGELSAYRLEDASTVSVTAAVTREDPSRPAVCILRARSVDGSETGRREILVPPSKDLTVQVTAIVKTTKPPVAGDVYGCSLAVPSYLVEPQSPTQTKAVG